METTGQVHCCLIPWVNKGFWLIFAGLIIMYYPPSKQWTPTFKISSARFLPATIFSCLLVICFKQQEILERFYCACFIYYISLYMGRARRNITWQLYCPVINFCATFPPVSDFVYVNFAGCNIINVWYNHHVHICLPTNNFWHTHIRFDVFMWVFML